jgi:hypothetical protein
VPQTKLSFRLIFEGCVKPVETAVNEFSYGAILKLLPAPGTA